MISRHKRGIQHRVISSVCHLIMVTLSCGGTDGRSRDYYVTTKFSWLDSYQICLATVLRWRATRAGFATRSTNRKNKRIGQVKDSPASLIVKECYIFCLFVFFLFISHLLEVYVVRKARR